MGVGACCVFGAKGSTPIPFSSGKINNPAVLSFGRLWVGGVGWVFRLRPGRSVHFGQHPTAGTRVHSRVGACVALRDGAVALCGCGLVSKAIQ